MMSKLWAVLVRVFGPKRDDPKRTQPKPQAGPKRDDPK